MRNEPVEKPLLTTRQKEVLIALFLGAAIVAFVRPTPITWN
ncbi:hypothetical protein WDW37_10600 [Bdellovibrionota bacterium FG-1]